MDPFIHGRFMVFGAALALGACAAVPRDEAPTGAAPGAVQRLIVSELPMRGDKAALAKQFASDLPPDSPQEASAVDAALERAQGRALERMRALLSQQPRIDLVDESAARAGDAWLRFRITDYGSTPKAWRKGYIAFEVTSTLAIAALAYAYPATRAVAGVYLVEEGIEETAEGYAGFWALDEVCRPVRLEAQLAIDGQPPIWEGSATGLSHIALGRLMRKVDPAEQEMQRDQAMDEALAKLVTEIAQALGIRGQGRNSGHAQLSELRP